MRRILVISVHPDDETLGCGGTILKHKTQGDEVGCLFVTAGNEHQRALIDQIAEKFAFDFAECVDFKENTIDDTSLNVLIPSFATVINKYRPSVLYIPNRSDVHSDHRRTFDAIAHCIKSFRYPFIKKVLMCEVISETDFAPAVFENTFQPNVFVDISDFYQQKMDIMKMFESEMLDDPYTRSLSAIEALHRYRGSQAAVQYAEAFMLIKDIC